MTPDLMQKVLDEVARAWLFGVTIPSEYKTKNGACEPIPEDGVMHILFKLCAAGKHANVHVDGVKYTVYMTYYRTRVWVKGNWNADPPTAEGEIVVSALSRIAHELRDQQVQEAIDKKEANVRESEWQFTLDAGPAK